jgi:hypothetical protein
MRLRLYLVELPHAAPNEVPGCQTLGALGTSLPLLLEQFGLDGSRNLLGNLILKRQDVTNIAVIPLRPDGPSCLGLGELG